MKYWVFVYAKYFQDALYGSISFTITPWGKHHHYLYFTSKENRTSDGWIALLLSGRTGTKMSQCKAHDLEKTRNSQQWKVSEWSHSLKLYGFEGNKMDRHTHTLVSFCEERHSYSFMKKNPQGAARLDGWLTVGTGQEEHKGIDKMSGIYLFNFFF